MIIQTLDYHITMEELYKHIILAIIQAVTELLPISSSGHLLVAGEILDIDVNQSYMIYLHFWTALAIIIIYFKKLISFIINKEDRKKILWIIVGIIPAGLAGVLFDDIIEQVLYRPAVVLISMFIWGVVMVLLDSEKLPFLNKENFINKLTNPEEKPCFKKVLLVGVAQVIALIPGTSRSGISIIAGRIQKLNIKDAIDWAFILGIPVTIGPFLIDLVKGDIIMSEFFSTDILIIGFTTLIFGLISMIIIRKLINSKFLKIFGTYRIIASIILSILFIVLL